MSNKFALNLYGRLRGKGNFVYSPSSLGSVLLRAAVGAAGLTRYQMLEALGLPDNDTMIAQNLFGIERQLGSAKGITLNQANGLYAQTGYDFVPEYLNLFMNRDDFHRVDFTNDPDYIRRQANLWVKIRTVNRIPELMQEGALNADVRLLIVNATYLKALWARQFPKGRTVKDDFYPTPDTPMKAWIMQQYGEFPVMRGNGLKVIQMPYAGNELSMLVLLPDEGVRLVDVENEVIMHGLEQYLRHLRTNDVILSYPRHSLTWGTAELSKALQDLGITAAFNSSEADFTRMARRRELYVSKVFHQASMDIDEEGTVASAGSAASMAKEARQRAPFTFDAIRPFTGIIRHHQTGRIVFMSRVVTPTPA